jgi:hypothetical protein
MRVVLYLPIPLLGKLHNGFCQLQLRRVIHLGWQRQSKSPPLAAQWKRATANCSCVAAARGIPGAGPPQQYIEGGCTTAGGEGTPRTKTEIATDAFQTARECSMAGRRPLCSEEGIRLSGGRGLPSFDTNDAGQDSRISVQG